MSPVAVVLLAVMSIVILSIGGFSFAKMYGKNSLYEKGDQTTITLKTEEIESLADLEVEVWNENWIRYNGKIYQYNEDILTFLVMGIDQLKEVEVVPQGISGGQADALFLVVCNPDDQDIEIIAINRNTMVDLDLYDANGYYAGTKEGQIALQHGYGDGATLSCERTRDQVSKLFYGIPIHGYGSMNMGAITVLNDAVGGVEVTITEDVEYSDGIFEAGTTELLLGDRAYHFLHQRDRNTFDSATDRLNRQKQYLKSFMVTVKEQIKTNPTIVFTLYNQVMNYVVTDITPMSFS